MKALIINVKRASGLLLPPGDSEYPEERKGLLLLPGENQVSERYWDAVKGNPGVKIWLGGNYLKNKGKGKARTIIEDWNDLTLEKAAPLIKAIKDAEQLLEIKKVATKKGLVSLCEDRIDELIAEAEEDNI